MGGHKTLFGQKTHKRFYVQNTHMSKKEDFPKYDIYGTPAKEAPVSYFHLENTREIAVEHNWDFKPHVHVYLYQMIWVKKGKGVFSAEGKTIEFKDNWVVFIVPNTLHSISFEQDAQVWSLYFTHDFMNVGYLGNMLQDFMGNVSRPMYKYIAIPEQKELLWEDLFFNLRQEFKNPYNLGYNASIKSWVVLLLTQLVRINTIQTDPDNKNPNFIKAEHLTNTFIHLLEQHYKREHRVTFYATKMNISSDTLNNHIRAVMNRTVGNLIRERIVLEAKRQLLYANKSVNQVAYLLNFEDDSYFIRFFKRETGMTPKAYKKQHIASITDAIGI